MKPDCLSLSRLIPGENYSAKNGLFAGNLSYESAYSAWNKMKNICLRPFERRDFTRLIAWIDSEQLLYQFAGPVFQYPLTEFQLEHYLAESDRIPYVVEDCVSGKAVGHAEIFRLSDTRGKLCRLLISDPRQRGRGIGQELVRELLRICREEFGFQEMELNVYDWNLPAIHCYEKAGFVRNPLKSSLLNIGSETWRSVNMTLTFREQAEGQ